MTQQSILKLCIVSFAALVLASRCAAAQNASGPTLTSATQAQVEKLVQELMTQEGVPGLSVAIAKNNQLVFSKGFGIADVENNVPVTESSRFRTASIAKSMTAVVVLSLSEKGTLKLDAEVQEYCPEYEVKEWPVTSRQLLGHLGGVRHYKHPMESRSTEHYYNLKSALRTFADEPLLHPPGSKYLDSTFGYNLLGSVAEGASGKSFTTLLTENVFQPSGMMRTGIDEQASIIPGRVAGYFRPTRTSLTTLIGDSTSEERKSGALYNAALHDTSMKIPGGGLLSTSSDLVRFAIAVNTGRLLSDETRRFMWTAQKTDDGKSTGYGLGWSICKLDSQLAVSHTGGQAGTSTVLLLVPDTGTVVALMCNLQDLKLLNTAREIVQTVQPAAPDAIANAQPHYSAAIQQLSTAIRHEVDSKQLPAFSIALIDDDKAVWSAGFGHQDADKKIPATADTVYRVGSVSKLFTDIAIMQLVESGQIDLDAPVQTYLPTFAPMNPFGVPITLRQLMSHRSGLVRESPVGNYFDPNEPTLAATVSSLNDTALVYRPETKTKYSNAAVSVVGSVLESKLAVSHPQQVRETILAPLHMHSSSFVVTADIEPHLATGWMHTYDGRRFEAPTFLLGTGPAGNMYSSVLDLSKFLVCVFRNGKTNTGQILKPESLEQMLTPVRDASGKSQGFGLGFHIQDLDGHTRIGHGGAIYGFSTQLEALPERRLGVAAAASLDGSNGVVERLANYALRLMIATQDGKPLPMYQVTQTLPIERAVELVGNYKEANSDRFTRITALNGETFMQRGTFRYRLGAAESDGSILTDDATGFGTTVKLESADRLRVGDVEYQRTADAPLKEIPSRWKGLIGEYGWDHNTLYILEDNHQLYALIEWFYYYPLTEVDDNTFLFPDYGLYHGERLKFARDASGIATQVEAAEVNFKRREVGTKDGETFAIRPVKPIDELRAEALSASPPVESGDFLTTDLIELTSLDPTIKLDIRYASTNNFTGSVFYKQARAFMQRPAAEAVARAHQQLKKRGLGLLVHDAYRPWHVTKMFWDATPAEFKDFVANPANGSRHNRGCAVDITLYDLDSGEPIQMVAGYDEFSSRSFPLYPGGKSRQRWYRELLRQAMEAEGFTVYEFEWWHFDFKDWKRYRIGNKTFEEVLR